MNDSPSNTISWDMDDRGVISCNVRRAANETPVFYAAVYLWNARHGC